MTILSKNTSNRISIFSILLINFLFGYKYLLRITPLAFIITLSYTLFLYIVSEYLLSKKTENLSFIAKILYFSLAIYCIIAITALFFVDPTQLRVDRWSVITSFWDTVRAGQFPYLAKSHMGCPPGPFPFYFVLSLPFYLLGEIGYFSLAGVLAMVWGLGISSRDDPSRQMAATFLVLSSAAIWWEIIARSGTLINAALIVLYIYHVIRNQEASRRKIMVMGFVGGLLQSTRGIFALPLIIGYTHCFVRPGKIKEFFLIGVFYVLGFLATLLPLVLWDFNSFLQYNPLTLQMGFVGLKATIGLMVMAFAAGIVIKTPQQLYLVTGIILIAAVMVYFVDMFQLHGLSVHSLLNCVDLSYLILSLPFFLFALRRADEEGAASPTEL